MRAAESFEKTRVKKYGEKTEMGPFRRCIEFLKSEPGRIALNQCLKASLKPCGNACGGGIPQCIQNFGQPTKMGAEEDGEVACPFRFWWEGVGRWLAPSRFGGRVQGYVKKVACPPV